MDTSLHNRGNGAYLQPRPTLSNTHISTPQTSSYSRFSLYRNYLRTTCLPARHRPNFHIRWRHVHDSRHGSRSVRPKRAIFTAPAQDMKLQTHKLRNLPFPIGQFPKVPQTSQFPRSWVRVVLWKYDRASTGKLLHPLIHSLRFFNNYTSFFPTAWIDET
jgi:hypothetical protein